MSTCETIVKNFKLLFRNFEVENKKADCLSMQLQLFWHLDPNRGEAAFLQKGPNNEKSHLSNTQGGFCA
jgi:hypothetical protein